MNRHITKFLLLILLLPAISACNTYFIPCSEYPADNSSGNRMIPVKQGNSWEYSAYNITYKNDTSASTAKRLSIGSATEVWADTKEGHKYFEAYVINVDDKPTHYYYIPCSTETIFAEASEKNPKKISFGFTIHENPTEGLQDNRMDFRWLKTQTISVPAGTFDCWVGDLDHPMNPKIVLRYFYAKDIGLVKSQTLNMKGAVISEMILEKFLIK